MIRSCFCPFMSARLQYHASRRSVNRSFSLLTSSSESLDSGCPDPPAKNGNMGWPILAMREMSFALAVSGFCKTQKKQTMVNEQYL